MSIIYTSCLMCIAFLSAASVNGAIAAAGVVTAIGASDNVASIVNQVSNLDWFPYRECTISVMNHCTCHSLVDPRMYVHMGRNAVPMPHTVGPQMKTTLQFTKVPWSGKGVSGVFTYDLRSTCNSTRTSTRLAIMFSVPYDKVSRNNWHAAGFFPLSRFPDYDLYEDMYYYDFSGYVRRHANEHIVYKHGEFTVKVTMADNGTPVMRVEIFDNWQEYAGSPGSLEPAM